MIFEFLGSSVSDPILGPFVNGLALAVLSEFVHLLAAPGGLNSTPAELQL